MEIALLLKAVILGIVEGLTEFLPISSTGHLILAGDLLDFNDDKGKVFEIVIQAGAILAICWEYRQRIAATFSGLFSDPVAQRFTVNLMIAFMPLAVFGLLFQKVIKSVLFKPVPVALAFIVGGVIILFAERWYQRRRATHATALGSDPESVTVSFSATASLRDDAVEDTPGRCVSHGKFVNPPGSTHEPWPTGQMKRI